MGSCPTSPISPRKLRSDLYSFSNSQDDHPNTPLVISVLASLLERTMARNQRLTTTTTTTTTRQCMLPAKSSAATAMDIKLCAFHCDETLDMSIQSFLERIFRYTHVAPPIYVVAYIYIDRLCQIHPEFRITMGNVHRLLITTIMTASKFVEDMNYRNSYFARVGGMTTEEMNKLEVEFLFLMGFKLHVNVSVFDSYCSHLEREVSIGGGYQIERSLSFMCCGQNQINKQSHRAGGGGGMRMNQKTINLIRSSNVVSQ